MSAPAARPRDRLWRWAVLNAVDLVHVWGGGPVPRDAWTRRYRPDGRAASVQRAWDRMKRGLRAVGVPYRCTADGLELSDLAAIERLAKALDAWLIEQPAFFLERGSAAKAERRRHRDRQRKAEVSGRRAG